MRRVLRLWYVTVAVAVPVVLVLLAAAFVWSVPSPSPEARSTGVNALWARHSWVGEAHPDAEIAAFAARLRDAQISDVFAHTGPFDGDGTVPAGRYRHARSFIAALHRLVPGIRVQAYLGQLLPAGGGPLRLDEPGVRARIVATAGELLDLGFDGIHYDIEPLASGDEDMLEVLALTRQRTAAHGGVLSVAVEELEINAAISSLARLVRPTFAHLEPDYLVKVADRVDQVAVMTYDSGLPTASSYAAYTAWQTVRTAELIGDRVTVFIGIPSQDEDQWDHHPWAESIPSGLHGLRRGIDTLNGAEGRGTVLHPVGAALFAEWTTSDDEWRDLIADWVRPPT